MLRRALAALIARHASLRTTFAAIEGKPMQFVTLQDEGGLIDVTLFPGHCPPVPHLLLGPYLARGVVEDQYGVITLTAKRFELVS